MIKNYVHNDLGSVKRKVTPKKNFRKINILL